jgi:type IX secretion system PorP/SprF family membrane protein
MRTRIIIFVLLFTGIGVYAQQDAQYTNYMYNTININPAYAGSRGCLSVFGLHRTQWVGLDGAPVTNTFSIQTPIANTNVGLGLGVVNDRIGPSNETNVAADFSYSIKTSETYKLSFGAKASANFLSVDLSSKSLKQELNDPRLANNIDRSFSPNIGAGLYLHSENTYIGLSVPNILETKHFDKSDSGVTNVNYTAKERMNFYAIAGHVFDLTENIKFKPAVLAKIVTGAPLQVDATANFMFNEKFVLGAAYRWSAALSALVGFQANDSWFIGYGYDFETTKLSSYNSGSHEIFLRYEMFNKYDKIVSPRFF